MNDCYVLLKTSLSYVAIADTSNNWEFFWLMTSGKRGCGWTAHGLLKVCNNLFSRIYKVTQIKSAWEAEGLLLPSKSSHLYGNKDWGDRNFFPLVHTQHDQRVLLTQHCWITHIPDKAAREHSSASAQLHPVVTIGLSWISDLQGVCFMKIWVVLW